VQHTYQSFQQKQPLLYAVIAIFGAAALFLGLALIILAHYHERAYLFLGLGAAGFIGGIAGIVVAGSKAKVALGYGVIALGMMGLPVGLNYLVNRYGAAPNGVHGIIVIALSIIAILGGIVGVLIVQPKGGIAAVFM
jgi:predicted neutral ceramidase superfamily lipid hydrolase